MVMPNSEWLCLKWKDFQNNVNTALKDLRKDTDFTDVTLSCEDGYQINAHKVVLSASSPFFQHLLKRNKHPNPLIYMRGMKSEDLVALVDFFYYGEANIAQGNLDKFLHLTKELQLKGLNETNSGSWEEENDWENIPGQKYNLVIPSSETKMENDSLFPQIKPKDQGNFNSIVAHTQSVFSADKKDLDTKIEHGLFMITSETLSKV